MPRKQVSKKLLEAAPAAIAVLSPHNLPFRMLVLVQTMSRHFQNLLDPHGLTPLHWGILSVLWARDGRPAREITRELEQLGGTITVGLDSMEKRGLVKRRRDTQDGRVLRVWLTKRGVNLEKDLVPEVKLLLKRMFACLSHDQIVSLSHAVDLLRAHLQDRDTGRGTRRRA